MATRYAGWGIYSVMVKVNNSSGIGQVAIDDPDLTENGSGNRLINISTRGWVGTGTYEELVGGLYSKVLKTARKSW